MYTATSDAGSGCHAAAEPELPEVFDRGLRVMDMTAITPLHGEPVADRRVQYPGPATSAGSWKGGDRTFVRGGEESMKEAIAHAKDRMGKSIRGSEDGAHDDTDGQGHPQPSRFGRVEAYGSMMPLTQVASISAPQPRLLVVQPWDKDWSSDPEGNPEGRPGVEPCRRRRI